MKINKRKLTYHPSYSHYPECPCILVGNRSIAKKYNWRVGDEVLVIESSAGVLIKKSLPEVDRQ